MGRVRAGICKTWAGDDWKACRDHVKWALGIRDGERPKFERTPRPAVNPREIEAKSDFAVKQYYRAQPPQETLVEIYLRHRRIVLTDDVIRADVIRFDPRCGFRLKDGKLIFLPAMVGLFRNIHSDEPRAIHKTALMMLEAAGTDWQRAVELDPMDAEARVAHGAYLSMKGRFSEAAEDLRRAIELAPMHAQVLRAAAEQMPYLGEVEEGARLADRANRLDPYLPPGNKNGLIEAYFYAGRFEKVIEITRSMPDQTRNKWTMIDLAMSYAYLNRTKEAAEARAAYLERFGQTSAEQWLIEGQPYVRPQERDLFVNGFRKLGLPICATDTIGKSRKASAPAGVREDLISSANGRSWPISVIMRAA